MDETIVQKKQVQIPNAVVIKDLASLFEVPVPRVITELMKNGVMSSMNERIDFDTAAIIADNLGFAATLKEEADDATTMTVHDQLAEHLKADVTTRQVIRPPVVVIMGHVDHGKTKLLDAIRETDIAAGEAGGITQHIGAYQVEVPVAQEPKSRPKDGIHHSVRDDIPPMRKITFIDTPGHEAFTAMRSRGAQVADLAILVVAADDGLKPQTLEAIKIIQQAKLPFLVAINKIDKPEANVEHVKKQLAEQNLLTEDWGGKVITVPVSATTKKGLDELLDTVLLAADVEPERRQADPDRGAIGSVIEARIDRGEGPVATAIIHTGTLHTGDQVRIGDTASRVKALKNWHGKLIATAGPSEPVRILGLREAPVVGDLLVAIEADEAKQLRRSYKPKSERVASKMVYQKKQDEVQVPLATEQKKLNILLRCDNLGSQEAIVESIAKMENPYVAVDIVAKGLGNISDADVLRADTAHALLMGFHVIPTPRAADVAKSKQVSIHTYTVIYELLNDLKREMEALLPIEVVETVVGRMKVLAVFNKDKRGMVVGGRVLDGVIRKGGTVRALRGETKVADGTALTVQQQKQAVAEATRGNECGIRFEGGTDIAVDDSIECYTSEERRIQLSFS